MRKEIQIEEIEYGSRYKKFIIIKQTCIGEKFGKDGCEFKASNGIILDSCGGPEWDEDGLLFVWGDSSSSNMNEIICRQVDFYRILEAIEEYNKFFNIVSIPNVSISNRYKENLKNPRKEVSF